MKKYHKAMRKTLCHILPLSLAAILVAACSKEEVPTYDTTYTSLNIWVGTQGGAVYENTTYNYSYAYEEGSVTFYAQVTGLPADHDRQFRIEPYGGDSAAMANTIRTEDYVIKAGETTGMFKVWFDTQKLAPDTLFSDTDGTIHFRMVPNDEFQVGTEGHSEFTVVLKNYLAKPDNWDAANFPQQPLSRYFGTYSKVKYQFMIEVLGLIDFQINYNARTSYNEATNTVSSSYAVYLLQQMQEALDNYNATHATPLVDEYGNPVSF